MDRKGRSEIIIRIGQLLDNQCNVCPKNKYTNGSISEINRICGDCKTYEELQYLGRFLNADDDGEKAKKILAKGKEMTTSEFLYLLENGVAKKKIYTALKMNRTEFHKMLKNFHMLKEGVQSES